jgi:hypothetical protein
MIYVGIIETYSGYDRDKNIIGKVLISLKSPNNFVYITISDVFIEDQGKLI